MKGKIVFAVILLFVLYLLNHIFYEERFKGNERIESMLISQDSILYLDKNLNLWGHLSAYSSDNSGGIWGILLGKTVKKNRDPELLHSNVKYYGRHWFINTDGKIFVDSIIEPYLPKKILKRTHRLWKLIYDTTEIAVGMDEVYLLTGEGQIMSFSKGSIDGVCVLDHIVKLLDNGNNTVYAIDETGNCYGIGNNEYGQIIPYGELIIPSFVLTERNVTEMSATKDYIYYIKDDRIVGYGKKFGQINRYDTIKGYEYGMANDSLDLLIAKDGRMICTTRNIDHWNCPINGNSIIRGYIGETSLLLLMKEGYVVVYGIIPGHEGVDAYSEEIPHGWFDSSPHVYPVW